jgi:hypothetical protein
MRRAGSRGACPVPDSPLLAAVEAHVAAFNQTDLDAVMAGFADDAVFTAAEQTVIGARAIRGLFADSFASPVRAELVLERVVLGGDTAACELAEHLTVDDVTHTIDVAAFYTVRDDQLVRVRIYRDLPSA